MTDAPRHPPTLAEGVDLVAAGHVLSCVETLPVDAIGILCFPRDSALLVDARRICWGAVKGRHLRLGEQLRLQRNPPLQRSFLAQVVEVCRTQGTALGEALLATGEVSERGLHHALSTQVAGTVAHIAAGPWLEPKFRTVAGTRYDPRFVFDPVEVLVGLGGAHQPTLALWAQRHLEATVPQGETVLACTRVRDVSGGERLTAIAGRGLEALSVEDILDVGELEMSACGADDAISEMTSGGCPVRCWRQGPLGYVAFTSEARTAERRKHTAGPLRAGTVGRPTESTQEAS